MVPTTHSPVSRRLKILFSLVATGGIAVRLWFILGLRFMEEDSLITLRYSQNLWRQGALVYNPDEHVMGFTSPLWTLLVSLLGGPFDFELARLGITLFSLCLYGAACALTIRYLQKLTISSSAQVFVALMLAFHTSLIAESISGMEMSLFYLMVIWSALALQANKRLIAFAVASLAVLTRPEGAIWWLALFVFCLLTSRKRLLRAAVPISIAIYLPWLIFATLYYGTFIPQSALSKSGWLFGGSFVNAVWRPAELYSISLLMSGSAVWSIPFGLQLSILLTWLLLFTWGMYLAHRRGHRISLLFGAYATSMILFYYFGRGITFPWYAFVPNILFVLVISETVDHVHKYWKRQLSKTSERLQPLLRPATLVLVSLAVLAYLGIMGIRTLSWIDVRAYEDNVLRATGEFINSCSKPTATVMLEPLGYVGYFSQRRVLDLAGLVSPDFAPTPEKFEPGWGMRQIETYKPDWLVLRKYEISANRFYASFDRPMFRDVRDRELIDELYVEENSFGEGEMGLVVMRRRDLPSHC